MCARCFQGRGSLPGGLDCSPPEATLVGEWDKVGSVCGKGGNGDPEAGSLERGNAGAVRIRFPGYYDVEYHLPFDPKTGRLPNTGGDLATIPEKQEEKGSEREDTKEGSDAGASE